jgi:hypothetical protein
LRDPFDLRKGSYLGFHLLTLLILGIGSREPFHDLPVGPVTSHYRLYFVAQAVWSLVLHVVYHIAPPPLSPPPPSPFGLITSLLIRLLILLDGFFITIEAH